MNERIKELITQVGTDVSGKWMNVDNVGKLAELIVKECADIADNAEPYKANDLIKKHFGFETWEN
jgi:hypothetical protein